MLIQKVVSETVSSSGRNKPRQVLGSGHCERGSNKWRVQQPTTALQTTRPTPASPWPLALKISPLGNC